MNNQNNMRILLSVISQPRKMMSRRINSNEYIECLASHLNGAGLLEITHHEVGRTYSETYRFTKYGELIGAFQTSENGEKHLLHDRTTHVDHRAKIEKFAESILTKI